ncbi:MAG: hypothetical protein ABIH72_02625 [archaeon]
MKNENLEQELAELSHQEKPRKERGCLFWPSIVLTLSVFGAILVDPVSSLVNEIFYELNKNSPKIIEYSDKNNQINGPRLHLTHALKIDSKRDDWTDTGIDVIKGDLIDFDARGKVRFKKIGLAHYTIGPEGERITKDINFLAPGHNAYGLVGMIDIPYTPGSFTFDIGPLKRFDVPLNGRLYLGMNEDVRSGGLVDNQGAWDVDIRLYRNGGGRFEKEVLE